MALKDLPRFYAPDCSANALARIDTEEAQHAKVLRLKVGDVVHVVDGSGRLFEGPILSIKPSMTIEISDPIAEQSEASRSGLTLGVAPTKNTNRLEWIIEKAAEVGVDSIILLQCHHSERKHVQLNRLHRIAISAMKQSKNLWRTEVSELTNLGEVLEHREGTRWIAHCNDTISRESMNDLTASPKGSPVTVLIGPEGDFSEKEINDAIQAGWKGLDLGEKRLRTETAAITAAVAASLLRH